MISCTLLRLISLISLTLRSDHKHPLSHAVVASNKVCMLDDGVIQRIRSLLRSDMPPVQFKLLGTLRMMVDGQGQDAK